MDKSTSGTKDSFARLRAPQPGFNLGLLVVTAAAREALMPEDLRLAFTRHGNGDWGDVCPDDRRMNQRGVRQKGMIQSVYRSTSGTVFWVITDPGHQTTTVLLPDDY